MLTGESSLGEPVAAKVWAARQDAASGSELCAGGRARAMVSAKRGSPPRAPLVSRTSLTRRARQSAEAKSESGESGDETTTTGMPAPRATPSSTWLPKLWAANATTALEANTSAMHRSATTGMGTWASPQALTSRCGRITS